VSKLLHPVTVSATAVNRTAAIEELELMRQSGKFINLTW